MAAERLEVVQIMRGMAASAVLCSHLRLGIGGVDWGGDGVSMFFVISGFVIPHAMRAIDYEIKDAWSFFLRRVIRLEPPYVAVLFSMVVISSLAARTPGYRGAPFNLSIGDFLAQFLYVAPWLHIRWLNPVTWTLAVEFQYYLFMLVFAPLLLSNRLSVRATSLCLVVLLTFVWHQTENRYPYFHHLSFFFAYLPIFAVGFSVFLFIDCNIALWQFLPLLVLFAAGTFYERGAETAFVSAVSSFVILIPIHRPVPILSFLGTISYSLYLVHMPIIARTNNLVGRVDWLHAAGPIPAICACLFAALLVWYFVERPAHRWAKTVVVSSAAEPKSDCRT